MSRSFVAQIPHAAIGWSLGHIHGFARPKSRRSRRPETRLYLRRALFLGLKAKVGDPHLAAQYEAPSLVTTLGWLNRRHGPILTTTLPVVPSPADLLVA